MTPLITLCCRLEGMIFLSAQHAACVRQGAVDAIRQAYALAQSSVCAYTTEGCTGTTPFVVP